MLGKQLRPKNVLGYCGALHITWGGPNVLPIGGSVLFDHRVEYGKTREKNCYSVLKKYIEGAFETISFISEFFEAKMAPT